MNQSGIQHIGFRVLATLASVVIVVAGMRAAQPILIPLLVSVFLAVLGLPPLAWLQKKKVPTGLSVLIVVIGMLMLLGVIGTLVGNSIDNFVAAIPRYQARLTEMVDSLNLPFRQSAPETGLESGEGVTTPTMVSQKTLEAEGGGPLNVMDYVNPGALMSLVGGTLKGLAGVLSNTLLVVLTMVFILLEAAGFPQKVRAALGRPDADLSRFSVMTSELQRYLGIKTVTSLATGILLGFWVAILGVDFPLLWGLVAFLLNFIPTLGSIIAAVPPVLLALIQTGTLGLPLAVGGGYMAVNMVIGNMIEPSLMGRKLGLSTLVVFLSMVFWGWVWGPVGMFLSVPLTMILKILLENSDDFRWVAVLLGSGGGVTKRIEPRKPSES